MGEKTFDRNTINGLWMRRSFEMEPSHIMLIQGYIGRLLTISHDT